MERALAALRQQRLRLLSGLVALAAGIFMWSTVSSGSPALAEVQETPAPAARTAESVPVFPDFSPLTASNCAPAAPPAVPTRPAASAEDSDAIRLRLTPSRPRLNPDLAQGYRHLQDNALDAARQAYDLALRAEPHNLDILLGLAAVAERQGRDTEADSYRQRAWIADPLDARTQAALLGRPDGDASAAESRLQSALSQHPESAALHFALGNLYARQQRWAEAQAAYFNAVASDGDNPDYLFNLAVSLDQLRHSPLAARHYRLALAAAQQRPAAFSAAALEQRLRELSP